MGGRNRRRKGIKSGGGFAGQRGGVHPHAASFLVFFVNRGGVHLARRLFFGCPFPPLPARSMTRRCASHMPGRLFLLSVKDGFPPSPHGKINDEATRRHEFHTPSRFFSFVRRPTARRVRRRMGMTTTTCSSSSPRFFINNRGNFPLLSTCGVIDRGRRETHTPVPFEFVPPSLRGITPTPALSKGGRCATHTPSSLQFISPPPTGGIFLVSVR